MIIFLLLIIIILVVLLTREKFEKRILKNDLREINEITDNLVQKESFERILYNTSSDEVKEVLVLINKLLDSKFNEQALRIKKERDLAETLTNMAHDLRTPLTIIKGYIEILLIESKDLKEKETINKLLKKIDDVIQLMNRFFTLSKLESGDEKLEIKKVNLNRVVKENLITHYDSLEKLGFEIDIKISEEIFFINGNEDALNRVLDNLISNVLKYGNEGNYLAIKLEKNKKTVILEVIDKGKGINKKDIKKIFDRCYTTRVSKENYIEGSGIGLRITKILMEAMNGTIKVESEAYRKTAFKIKFFLA